MRNCSKYEDLSAEFGLRTGRAAAAAVAKRKHFTACRLPLRDWSLHVRGATHRATHRAGTDGATHRAGTDGATHRAGTDGAAGAMLYLIGLGLGDAADITVKGLRAVRGCARVYLEAYTSILTVGKEALEEYYGKELILADRDLVEQGADEILRDADVTDVAFLVVGDPFGATTHSDLVLRAVNAGIPYKVIHNASIMNAVGCCGLQLYNFGETVSLVFWTDTWKPESFYDKICKNRTAGLHTLCLLDIKVKEQSVENMMRGKKIFEPPRFMTVAQAADQLIQIIQRRRAEGAELGVTEDTVCVGVARLGADDQTIRTATLRQLVSCDLGGPLHSLVITGQLHPLEVDMLRLNEEPNALQHLRQVDSSTYCS